MIVAAPIVSSLKPLQQFVFDGLSWEQYETLLDSLGERRLLELQFEEWVREPIRAKKEKS